MFEEIMTQIQPMIISIAVTILTAVASYVGVKVKQVFTEKVNTETKQKVVETTCRYVNQLYKDLDGAAKFEKAKAEILTQLNEKGIKISDLELEVLIEATVNGFKDGFSQGILLEGVIEEPLKIEESDTTDTEE